MAIDIKTLTIAKAHEALKRGDFTATELADAYLATIASRNGDVNAYLEVFADVRTQASLADERFKKGTAGPLTGIPLAIKDNIVIEGRRAGAASRILEGYVASYDATAIRKLKEQNAVFLGRVNMDEFAMGSSTENSAYGVTKNPHDTSRVAGGSSGGSAAALAMDGALAALGSDTGGSVRQPASLCGVVGLKPTYGTISRHGLMAMGSSLDVIGPLTKTVEDAEILFNVLKGKDRYDSTSVEYPDASAEKRPLVIGVPRAFLTQGGLDEAVTQNFKETEEKLRALGCVIKDIELPTVHQALPVYYILMPAEVSSNLARFDGVKYGLRKEGATVLEEYEKTRREGFGRESRRRILLGTYVLSSGYYDAYYTKANAVRRTIEADFATAFGEGGVDLILTPTTPSPAFKIGEKTNDPVAMYLEDIFTVPANIAGIPAISLPSGFKTVGENKLPLGVQFMAAWGREDLLFRAGKLFLGEGEDR